MDLPFFCYGCGCDEGGNIQPRRPGLRCFFLHKKTYEDIKLTSVALDGMVCPGMRYVEHTIHKILYDTRPVFSPP